MRIKLDQKQNEIYLTGYEGADLIDIRYSGTFIGDLIPKGFVAMNDKRIIIYNAEKESTNDLFMRYEGNLQIRDIFVYTKENSYAGVVQIDSDDFNNITGEWEDSDSKWEKLGYSNKYEKDLGSMLAYIKGKKRYYLSRGNRTNTIPSKIKTNEKNIVHNLIAKRGK